MASGGNGAVQREPALRPPPPDARSLQFLNRFRDSLRTAEAEGGNTSRANALACVKTLLPIKIGAQVRAAGVRADTPERHSVCAPRRQNAESTPPDRRPRPAARPRADSQTAWRFRQKTTANSTQSPRTECRRSRLYKSSNGLDRLQKSRASGCGMRRAPCHRKETRGPAANARRPPAAGCVACRGRTHEWNQCAHRTNQSGRAALRPLEIDRSTNLGLHIHRAAPLD